MTSPMVSVIIPVYNYEQYVLDAIQSCIIQNYDGKIEIIVVDDCSTDNSSQRIRTTFGSQVILMKTKRNSGYSFAKNLGIRNSIGDFIATLDADDMLTEDSIRIRACYLAKYPEIGFVHGRAYLIGDEGGIDYYSRRTGKLKIHGGRKIHAQTTMIRRLVHLRWGLYDENLRSRSDNEMWFRLRTVCDVPDIKIEDPPPCLLSQTSSFNG